MVDNTDKTRSGYIAANGMCGWVERCIRDTNSNRNRVCYSCNNNNQCGMRVYVLGDVVGGVQHNVNERRRHIREERLYDTFAVQSKGSGVCGMRGGKKYGWMSSTGICTIQFIR